MTKISYWGEPFYVDLETLEIWKDYQLLTPNFVEGPDRWYVSWRDRTGNAHWTPRSRIICLAANPIGGYRTMMADHINSD